MPSRPGSRSTSTHNFIRQKRIEIVNSVNLHQRRIRPAGVQKAEATFHFCQNKARFFADRIRCCLAFSYCPISITSW